MFTLSNPADLYTVSAHDMGGGIFHLHYDRKIRGNALTLAAYRDLADAFERLGKLPNAFVILFTTEGKRCGSGADLGYLMTLDTAEAARVFSYEINSVAARIETVAMEKPVIALIQGHVQGGMSHLVLAMTQRIVADADEFLREPGFANFRILGGGGGIPRLVRHLAYFAHQVDRKSPADAAQLAMGKAFEILVLHSDRFISGREGLSIGIVNDFDTLEHLRSARIFTARYLAQHETVRKVITEWHRGKMTFLYPEDAVRAAREDLIARVRTGAVQGQPDQYVAEEIIRLLAKALMIPTGEELMRYEAERFGEVFHGVNGPERIQAFLARALAGRPS